jgi:predicted transcriptional regulator
MEDVLDLDTRRNIHDLIKKNPGIHLSKIAQLLEMRTSLVEYHLLFLEKHDIIKSDKETGYKRYYLKGHIGTKDKRYLFILRQKTVLEIILFMIKHDVTTHKEILEHVNVSASTLSYHLQKLLKKEIIGVKRYGADRGYHIKNKDEVVAVLIEYKPYRLVDGFQDIWVDLSI